MLKEIKSTHIIIQSSESNVVPHVCPVCDYLLRTLDDENAYREFGCCDKCADKWARPNRQKWESGYRPNKFEAQQYIKNECSGIIISY